MLKEVTVKLALLVIFFLILTAGVAVSRQVSEEKVKVAIFDLQEVFGRYQKTKDFQAEFERYCQQVSAQLEEKRKEVEKLKEELIRQEMMLSRSERERKKEELRNKEEELGKLAQSIQREIEEKRQSYTKQIIEDILSMCLLLKEEKGYDLILDKSSLPDLTEEILLKLNEKYKGEK